jgi:hypothetical protein
LFGVCLFVCLFVCLLVGCHLQQLQMPCSLQQQQPEFFMQARLPQCPKAAAVSDCYGWQEEGPKTLYILLITTFSSSGACRLCFVSCKTASRHVQMHAIKVLGLLMMILMDSL